MTVKKLPFEEFTSIYDRVPRLCVELVVKTPQGFLMLKRDIIPWKNKWHLPGGTVLLNENITDTINRVAKEEIGVKVKVKKLLGFCEYKSSKIKGYKQAVSLVFLTTPLSLNFKTNFQSNDFKLFTQVPENTVSETKQFLLHSNTDISKE